MLSYLQNTAWNKSFINSVKADSILVENRQNFRLAILSVIEWRSSHNNAVKLIGLLVAADS